MSATIYGVGVGIGVTSNPLHRSVRAELPHTAPTSGVDAQIALLDRDVKFVNEEANSL
jgi:hypothetical protein